ncbi:MAG: hypothetical protein L6420_05025 [Elusimicrobia bacterium]|nr:hypothetical protein [Elusimicrobiota bacterium]
MGKKSFKKKFTANNRRVDTGKNSQNSIYTNTICDISWRIIFTAIAIIMVGYILLANADPLGKNIHSAIAPIFLLGGHMLIILGMVYTPK